MKREAIINGSRMRLMVCLVPYQTPALADWKTTLEKNGFRVRKIKEPVIGNRKALNVMIARLKAALDELGLAIK